MAGPKIFGIGLSKSGTNSLTEALSILGYNAWHGGNHTYHNGHDLWDALQDRGRRYAGGDTSVNILEGCEEYDAMTDHPIPVVYQHLDKQIPDAKFILTYRNPFDASLSMMRMCYPSWKDNVGDDKPRSFSDHINKNVKHIDEVFNYFWGREDKFIVLDAAKGKANWKMLCTFLGHDPQPHQGKPWPHKFNASHWFPQRWQREGKKPQN